MRYMKQSKRRTSVPTGIRFTPEDRRILKALSAKLGVGTAQILRVAIRKLAEIEQVGRSYAEDAVPVWELAAGLGERIPKDAWAGVPRDLSKNVDHYRYGAPKDDE
jgi:predicted DNA-binding protein